MILLGFSFVTAGLLPFVNPGTMGPFWGSPDVMPWVWVTMALPGFFFFYVATKNKPITDSSADEGNPSTQV